MDFWGIVLACYAVVAEACVADMHGQWKSRVHAYLSRSERGKGIMHRSGLVWSAHVYVVKERNKKRKKEKRKEKNMLCATRLCASLGWIVSTSPRHIFNGGVPVLVLSDIFLSSPQTEVYLRGCYAVIAFARPDT